MTHHPAATTTSPRPSCSASSSSSCIFCNYTAAEYGDWLTEVGFVDPQVVPFEAPGANGVVTARKP
jgi:hypothetical protein